MLMCTTWKGRGLSPEQTDRMFATWGKIEADAEARSDVTRRCWYASSDGTQGVTVAEYNTDAALVFHLEVSLALSEFLELDSRPVLDLDSAMPAITNAMERTKS
jgi:hypothetical protein